jgi:hypothetical protein
VTSPHSCPRASNQKIPRIRTDDVPFAVPFKKEIEREKERERERERERGE